MDEPLIYTTLGNVSTDSLDYTQEWDNHIESTVSLTMENGALIPKVSQNGYIVFIEKYHDKKTGELVKENRHVCVFNGQESIIQQAIIQ